MMTPEEAKSIYNQYLKLVLTELTQKHVRKRFPTRDAWVAMAYESTSPSIKTNVYQSAEDRYLGYTNSTYFEPVDMCLPSTRRLSCTYSLKVGMSATEALTDLVCNTDVNMVVNQHGYINIIQSYALLKTFLYIKGKKRGKQFFDKLFSGSHTPFIISPFSVLEGTSQACLGHEILHAPLNPLSFFFVLGNHKQRHPDNAQERYRLQKGDIVEFVNHKSYATSHPLGSFKNLVGVCVEPGNTHDPIEDDPFAEIDVGSEKIIIDDIGPTAKIFCPDLSDTPMPVSEIKAKLIAITNSTMPEWMDDLWARHHYQTDCLDAPRKIINADDLDHFVLPKTVRVDGDMISKLVNETFTITHVHHALAETCHVMQAKRENFFKVHAETATAMYEQFQIRFEAYQKSCEDENDPYHDYSCEMLNIIRPLLDNKGNFTVPLNVFIEQAPILHIIESCCAVYVSHAQKHMAQHKYESALMLWQYASQHQARIAFYRTAEEFNTRGQHYLNAATMERNAARCLKLLKRPMEELQYCQSCYGARIQFLSHSNPKVQEVKQRIEVLNPICDELRRKEMIKIYQIIGKTRDELFDKGLLYHFQTDEALNQLSLNILSLLEKTYNIYNCADAALLLAINNIEILFDLDKNARTLEENFQAGATKTFCESSDAKSLVENGLVSQDVVEEFRDCKTMNGMREKVIVEILKYMSCAFFSAKPNDDIILNTVSKYFKRFIQANDLKVLLMIIDNIYLPNTAATKCLAWCFIARELAAQKDICRKSTALNLLNDMWDCLDDAKSEIVFNTEIVDKLETWASQIGKAVCVKIKKSQPDLIHCIPLDPDFILAIQAQDKNHELGEYLTIQASPPPLPPRLIHV